MGEVFKYNEPHELKEIGIDVAPQSYMYLPDNIVIG